MFYIMFISHNSYTSVQLGSVRFLFLITVPTFNHLEASTDMFDYIAVAIFINNELKVPLLRFSCIVEVWKLFLRIFTFPNRHEHDEKRFVNGSYLTVDTQIRNEDK